jgi:hypothetical protein
MIFGVEVVTKGRNIFAKVVTPYKSQHRNLPSSKALRRGRQSRKNRVIFEVEVAKKVATPMRNRDLAGPAFLGKSQQSKME